MVLECVTSNDSFFCDVLIKLLKIHPSKYENTFSYASICFKYNAFLKICAKETVACLVDPTRHYVGGVNRRCTF